MTHASTPAPPFCFGTLGLGDKYRYFAQLLALDLSLAAPEIPFVVLTDEPGAFRRFPNVHAVRHRQRSVIRPYHDKRLVIAEGVARARACIFVDSDMRLLADVPAGLASQLGPGLSSPRFYSIEEKYQKLRREEAAAGKAPRNSGVRRWALMQQAAAEFGVPIEGAQFISEAFFAVRADGARTQAFLDSWAAFARFFELRGLTWGVGDSIGLATRSVGWTVTPMPPITSWLFNDLYMPARERKEGPLSRREATLLGERAIHDHLFATSAAAKRLKKAGGLAGMGARFVRTAMSRPPNGTGGGRPL